MLLVFLLLLYFCGCCHGKSECYVCCYFRCCCHCGRQVRISVEVGSLVDGAALSEKEEAEGDLVSFSSFSCFQRSATVLVPEAVVSVTVVLVVVVLAVVVLVVVSVVVVLVVVFVLVAVVSVAVVLVAVVSVAVASIVVVVVVVVVVAYGLLWPVE